MTESGHDNLITTPTGYALWHIYDHKLAIYIPVLERDCFVEIENIETKRPKTLLERSLALFKTNDNFSSCTELQPPVLQQWSGVLDATVSLKHLLRVVKLTGWEAPNPEGRYTPAFRAFPRASHEIHSFYESKATPNHQRLLFRVHLAATDEVAKQAGKYLANMMKSLQPQQGHRLVRYNLESYRRLFWAEMLLLYLTRDL